MDFPLGPILANNLLCHHETMWLKTVRKTSVL